MKTLFKIIVAPFKAVATLITIILMLITAAILILSGLFAVRAIQPLDRPEFGGLTYFEYVEYREWAQQHNPLMIARQKQYPDKESACAGFDRYDDVLLLGIGAYLSRGNLSETWVFFEDGLYQVDFQKKGLGFGNRTGCDLPLSPSITKWQEERELANDQTSK